MAGTTQAKKDLIEKLQNADMKDVVNFTTLLLMGDKMPYDKRDECLKSVMEMAKTGVLAVLHKEDIIGVLRESEGNDDDTVLEPLNL